MGRDSPNLRAGSARIHRPGRKSACSEGLTFLSNPDERPNHGYEVTKVTLPEAAVQGQCPCRLQIVLELLLTNWQSASQRPDYSAKALCVPDSKKR